MEKGRKLIGLQYTKSSKDNIIYCDIRDKDRITYEMMMDREGDARACALQSKGIAAVSFKQRKFGV